MEGGSRGGAVPSGASPSGPRCTGGDGADGRAAVVVQEVGKLRDTRGGEGEVTGSDQELAAPSGSSMSMPSPCRHRHQDYSLILGTKKRNCSCHLVQNSESYNFVVMRFCWFATWAIQNFQQTLLVKKGNQVLGL